MPHPVIITMIEVSVPKLVEMRKDAIQRAVLSWSRGNLRKFPWRQSRRTPYSILLAELLLRRTTAKAVSRVYGKLLGRFPDVKSLSRARKHELERALSTVGLQHQRSSAIREMIDTIMSKFNGKVPDNELELLSIPHIGQYTAGAIISFGYGRRASVVDSNVTRIIGRLFADNARRLSATSITQIADYLAPYTNHAEYNWALLDIGATLCTYKKPLCHNCPLVDCCDTGQVKTFLTE